MGPFRKRTNMGSNVMREKREQHDETREPTITEALNGFAVLPAVLSTLEQLRAQMGSMQNEIAALRKVSGNGDGNDAPITWNEAKGKRFVSLKEAAYLLDVSDKTVRRLLDRGLLKCSSGTRHRKISVDSLEEYGGKTIL